MPTSRSSSRRSGPTCTRPARKTSTGSIGWFTKAARAPGRSGRRGWADRPAQRRSRSRAPQDQTSSVRWRRPRNRSLRYPRDRRTMTAPEADLTGWTASPFTAEGITHDVYRKGEGPGVVLIPEIPGLTPQVLGLGNHLVDNGFSVASPSLFGEPGRALSVGYLVSTMARACIAREFRAFATVAERPVARYLREFARDLNERTPGKGVGVIGMC